MYLVQIFVVVFLSLSCPTLCHWMDCSTPGFPVFSISRSLLKLMCTESVMPSNHLILCYPLLLLPSVFPRIRVFSSESALCNRCPKYWSFSISPSNEYSGLISFRVDPCNPRVSQESSPVPQFKSISSLALSLLYGITLTLERKKKNLKHLQGTAFWAPL